MRRLFFAAIPAVLALILVVTPVGAGLQWCRTDPIVELNGTQVQIWAAIPEQYEEAVNGPVDFTIAIPEDVEREIIYLDEGLNGHGETVSFVDRGSVEDGVFTAIVMVSIPFDDDLLDDPNVPVEVEVIIDGESEFFTGAYGRAFAVFDVESSN